MRSGIDSITLEIIRNRLDSIIREMGEITLRTARSSVVYLGRDFSCGILNSRCELLSVGTSVPGHIFPIIAQVQNTLEKFKDDVRPGDIFMGNDPYDGGSHLNDILLFIPVFHDDDIVAYAVSRAHHTDVGGMVPGSLSGNAREIYQEGLRIPPIRVGQEDQFDANIIDFILRNVRVPEESRGDFWAQLASCRVGSRHITRMMQRYGKETTLAHFDEIMDASERRMRSMIRALPPSAVVHEDYLDNDGVQPDRRRIRVTVTIDDGDVVVDYTGTAPQSQGPLNTTEVMTSTFAFGAVKAALDPKGHINSGCFRPIRVVVPKGTMLNCEEPAAAGGWTELGFASILTIAALSEIVPDQTTAAEGAASHHHTTICIDRRGDGVHRFIYYDFAAGGSGARAASDGLDVIRSLRSGNANSQPVEVLEHLYPVHFQRQELRQDSGGPGRFRGGLGFVRECEVLFDSTYSLLGDHNFVPPAGVFGGESGAPARWELIRDGEVRRISPEFRSKTAGAPLRAGDVIRLSTQGGGGFGDPLERDPARVRQDVADGKVSPEKARRSYGVVLDGDDMTVDVEATREQRAELATGRSFLMARNGAEQVFIEGMRVAFVSPALVQQGFCEGELAEVYASRHPLPLRVRVGFDAALPDDAILLDDEAWATLAVEPGDRILWRKVD